MNIKELLKNHFALTAIGVSLVAVCFGSPFIFKKKLLQPRQSLLHPL